MSQKWRVNLETEGSVFFLLVTRWRLRICVNRPTSTSFSESNLGLREPGHEKQPTYDPEHKKTVVQLECGNGEKRGPAIAGVAMHAAEDLQYSMHWLSDWRLELAGYMLTSGALAAGQVPRLAARPANFFLRVQHLGKHAKREATASRRCPSRHIPSPLSTCIHPTLSWTACRRKLCVRYVEVRSFQSLFFETAILEWICQFVWYLFLFLQGRRNRLYCTIQTEVRKTRACSYMYSPTFPSTLCSSSSGVLSFFPISLCCLPAIQAQQCFSILTLC